MFCTYKSTFPVRLISDMSAERGRAFVVDSIICVISAALKALRCLHRAEKLTWKKCC